MSATMYRLLPFVAIVTVQLARAEACPPAVALTGDNALAKAVRDLLARRGINDETPACPAVHARIERRGPLLVVGTDGAGGVPVERVVAELATAATVIESWTRSDLAAPLLAVRPVPAIPDPAIGDRAEPAPVAASPPAARGIQLFAAPEMSIASDGTVWQGLQLGACIMLGPICGAARLHGGKVVSRPPGWDDFARAGVEAYIGIDVPLAIGRTRLTPGFAAGYGSMFTHKKSSDERMGIEISGPRAEVHADLSIPLSAHIAIDFVTTGALTQAAKMKPHGGATADLASEFPDEPRALLRLAVGIRYGSL
jgi:hypothetical protein